MKKRNYATLAKKGAALFLSVSLAVSGVGVRRVMTADAADDAVVSYDGTTKYTSEKTVYHTLRGADKDYILWPGETFGWNVDGENPSASISGNPGGLGCGCDWSKSHNYSSWTYEYYGGLSFLGIADNTDVVLTPGTKELDWPDAEDNTKTGTKTVAITQSMQLKQAAAGPMKLTYIGNPEVQQSTLKCSNPAYTHATYQTSTGYQFQVEALGTDSFAVTWNLDGGILLSGKTLPAQFYFAPESYKYTFETPVKLGYTFRRWKGTDSDLVTFGDQNYEVNQQKELRVNGVALLSDSSTDMRWDDAKALAKTGAALVADWKAAMVTIAYDLNGGSLQGKTEKEDETFTYRDSYATDTFPFAVEGEPAFDGWYIGDTKITCLQDIPASMWNAEQKYIVTAHWKHVHSGTKVEGKAATFTAAGTKEYYTCTCGKLFEDAACTKEITTDISTWKVVAAIDKVAISKTAYVYDGKAKAPTVKATDSAGKTIDAEFYTVELAGGRKNVGKYTVKVTFKGNYSGTKSFGFVINPKTTTISKVTAGKKQLKIKIKKLTAQTTGYEIQVATDKSFKKNVKTATSKKNTTTSVTIKKLKGNTKYYIRVRTYKTVGGKKYYSEWKTYSKTVKTKK